MKFKRFTAIIIAVVMTVSMIPSFAFADESESEPAGTSVVETTESEAKETAKLSEKETEKPLQGEPAEDNEKETTAPVSKETEPAESSEKNEDETKPAKSSEPSESENKENTEPIAEESEPEKNKKSTVVGSKNSGNPSISGRLLDCDLGTAVVGYDRLDFNSGLYLANNGTTALSGTSDYMKIELTGGDKSAFDLRYQSSGNMAPDGVYIKAYIYPKTGLSAKSYSATATVYYDEVKRQLSEMGIKEDVISFMEPVLPILEERIHNYMNSDTNQIDDLFPDKIEKEVLSYLEKNHLRMYNYSFYDEYLIKKTNIEYDSEAKLFYGLFNGKRMYLAKRFDTEQKARAYYNSVIMEQDLRSPHCYFNEKSNKYFKGNVIDIGAAEGVLGLKIIDKVDHLYMVEVDEEWVCALNFTYKDYLNKVTIINKFISDKEYLDETSIDSLFENVEIDAIKMDIEGYELKALIGARKVLRDRKPFLSVCVYHHKYDNENIKSFLTELGYECSNSKGVVVCYGDWELESEDLGFRKALLFGE